MPNASTPFWILVEQRKQKWSATGLVKGSSIEGATVLKSGERPRSLQGCARRSRAGEGKLWVSEWVSGELMSRREWKFEVDERKLWGLTRGVA